MLSTPTTCASIACATVAPTTAPLAPGYIVVTWTCGGTMSGYCASGITNSAKRPAIVVTSAMTIASRGLSTKMAESIGSALLQAWRDRLGLDRHAGADRLQAFDDHLLAARQTLRNNDVFAVGAAGLEPPDRDLPAIDDKDIQALLISDERRLWNQHSFLGLTAFEIYRHQLPIDENALWIGENGTNLHGVRGAIHRYIDKVDLTQLVIGRAIGKTQPDLDTGNALDAASLLGLHELALAHRKEHIHRILTDDRRQRSALGAHDIALSDRRAADLSSDRRENLGIAQVDLRSVEIGLIDHD